TCALPSWRRRKKRRRKRKRSRDTRQRAQSQVRHTAQTQHRHSTQTQFHSIPFYLYRAIAIQLSLGALQSPEPETPLVQAQWQHGQEKTPCYSGRNLKRTHGKIGRAHV